MQQIEPLVNGKYFHIFNRGTNSCNLFVESANTLTNGTTGPAACLNTHSTEKGLMN